VIWKAGKPHEWIIEGTKADGDRFEAQKVLELEAQPVALTRTVPTFLDFSTLKYTPHAKQHTKASTWTVRKYMLATLIEFFGPMRVSEIGLEQVERYKTTQQGRVTKRKGVTRKAGNPGINNELRLLRWVLSYAKELGYPVQTIKAKSLPERGQRRVKAWTTAELESLWAACRAASPDLLPLLLFLVNTGCRKGEAIAAEWSWMDLDAGMVRIPVNEYWQPKNNRPREVPMADAVRALLTGPKRHPTRVFTMKQGKPLKQFPERQYAKVRDLAGLTGGPHQLRHTFASHFLASVPDLFLLSNVLGHSHKSTTELYAHMLPDHLMKARNAVNITPTMAVTMATAKPTRKKRAKMA
jgi:integrase